MENSRSTVLLVDYFSATRNEIDVDRRFMNLSSLYPGTVGYLPRSPRWVMLAKHRSWITYTSWLTLSFLWVSGGALVFFFVEYLKFLLSTNSVNKRIDLCVPSGFVLALSSRVGDIVDPSKFESLPNIWITMPWAPLRRVPEGVVSVDVFSLLSRKELWQAYCFAVRSVYLLFLHKRTSKWVLQSYTAFRWFAVRLAVDKLSGRLVMAEHYDRWAVLVDSSVRANKTIVLPSGAVKERELVLIQHGSLGELGSSAGKTLGALKLPRKLGAVSHLHVYGREAEEAFKRDVLTKGCVRRGLKVHYFKPTIELTDVAAYLGLKLLFVGHPLCEALHEHVFESLRSRFQFKGYYKPHPLAPMSASIRQVGWEIIEDVATFPVVDLLIAYPSTLVVEYEGLGIPAAVHPMNLGCEGAVSYVKSVCELIDSIKAKQAFQ